MEQSGEKLLQADFDDGGRDHDPRNAAVQVVKSRK